ncbi:MAG TPA: hypothetical protein VIK93_09540 [Limnochordales bacterium]
MTWTAFVRNVLFAVILLLLVATLQEAQLPFTQRVEEYLAFVLTTDFDYQPWLDYLQARLELPDLSWLPVLGGSSGSPPHESSW